MGPTYSIFEKLFLKTDRRYSKIRSCPYVLQQDRGTLQKQISSATTKDTCLNINALNNCEYLLLILMIVKNLIIYFVLENDLGASSSGGSTVLNVQYPPSVQIRMQPDGPVSETDARYLDRQIDRQINEIVMYRQIVRLID